VREAATGEARLHRWSRARERTRGCRPQHADGGERAPQPLVRLGWSSRQPVGPEPAADARSARRWEAMSPASQRRAGTPGSRERLSAGFRRMPPADDEALRGRRRQGAAAFQETMKRDARRSTSSRCPRPRRPHRRGPLSAGGATRIGDLRRQGPVQRLPSRPGVFQRRVPRRRHPALPSFRQRGRGPLSTASRSCRRIATTCSARTTTTRRGAPR
jgi:hypothetical protein